MEELMKTEWLDIINAKRNGTYPEWKTTPQVDTEDTTCKVVLRLRHMIWQMDLWRLIITSLTHCHYRTNQLKIGDLELSNLML